MKVPISHPEVIRSHSAAPASDSLSLLFPSPSQMVFCDSFSVPWPSCPQALALYLAML